MEDGGEVEREKVGGKRWVEKVLKGVALLSIDMEGMSWWVRGMSWWVRGMRGEAGDVRNH